MGIVNVNQRQFLKRHVTVINLRCGFGGKRIKKCSYNPSREREKEREIRQRK
jgi:hypothetical protein